MPVLVLAQVLELALVHAALVVVLAAAAQTVELGEEGVVAELPALAFVALAAGQVHAAAVALWAGSLRSSCGSGRALLHQQALALAVSWLPYFS